MEIKSCENCKYSIKDEPNYFCLFYRKYVWNEDLIPEWCNKHKVHLLETK